MSETISRKLAIDALDKCPCGGQDEKGNPWIYKENAVEAIEMVEPSEEPKTGKWINVVDGIEYTWANCNKCGARIPMAYKYYNFCPNCGADMRKDGENSEIN